MGPSGKLPTRESITIKVPGVKNKERLRRIAEDLYEEIGRLKSYLAHQRFGEYYHEEKELVRFEEPQILAENLAGIPPHRENDPHIKFFAKKNPGHFRGDELVCLAEISQSNLTNAGKRMWDKGDRIFAGRGQ